MGFRNPITTLSADHITGGTLAGAYVLTGSIQTASSGKRIALTGGGAGIGAPDQVTFFTGDAAEQAPGYLRGEVTPQFGSTRHGQTTVTAPVLVANPHGAQLQLQSGTEGGSSDESRAQLLAGTVVLGGQALTNSSGYAIVAAPAGASSAVIDGAAVSVTTDANGYATVPHKLGVTPLSVTCSGSPTAGSIVPSQLPTDTYTATTFRVRCLSPSGAVLANDSLTVAFLAFAAS